MNKLDYSETSVTSCGRCGHTWKGSYMHAPSHICKTRKKFNVTYEIVTQESAEYGDAAERGYIAENVSFRDAVRYLEVAGCPEADSCYPAVPRWITTQDDTYYGTGEVESRSLHIPRTTTASSAIRIARYLGAYTYARKVAR